MINLYYKENKIFSQNGEDGVIQYIFQWLGTTNKYFVEFGVECGTECNTRFLLEQGWSGLWMDGKHHCNPFIKQEFITGENINQLMDKYNVPHEFDLLSVDIDGQDYWVWKALKRRPRVVVIEYNGYLPTDSRKVIEYNPNFVWKHNSYYGAGLEALRLLGIEKGYTLAYCDFQLVNLFFIADEILPPKTVFDFRRTIRTNPIEHGDGPWVTV